MKTTEELIDMVCSLPPVKRPRMKTTINLIADTSTLFEKAADVAASVLGRAITARRRLAGAALDMLIPPAKRYYINGAATLLRTFRELELDEAERVLHQSQHKSMASALKNPKLKPLVSMLQPERKLRQAKEDRQLLEAVFDRRMQVAPKEDVELAKQQMAGGLQSQSQQYQKGLRSGILEYLRAGSDTYDATQAAFRGRNSLCSLLNKSNPQYTPAEAFEAAGLFALAHIFEMHDLKAALAPTKE